MALFGLISDRWDRVKEKRIGRDQGALQVVGRVEIREKRAAVGCCDTRAGGQLRDFRHRCNAPIDGTIDGRK
jgi:hypothetical protein